MASLTPEIKEPEEREVTQKQLNDSLLIIREKKGKPAAVSGHPLIPLDKYPDNKNTWIKLSKPGDTASILSVHLPSGKKSIELLKTHFIRKLQELHKAGELGDEIILVGDFNIDFSKETYLVKEEGKDKKLIISDNGELIYQETSKPYLRNGKLVTKGEIPALVSEKHLKPDDSGDPDLAAFINILSEFGITIETIEMTPNYKTDKARSGRVDNAQASKANKSNIAVKDIAIKIKLPKPDITLDEKAN